MEVHLCGNMKYINAIETYTHVTVNWIRIKIYISTPRKIKWNSPVNQVSAPYRCYVLYVTCTADYITVNNEFPFRGLLCLLTEIENQSALTDTFHVSNSARQDAILTSTKRKIHISFGIQQLLKILSWWMRGRRWYGINCMHEIYNNRI